jgi:hypothetical protein
MTKPIHPRPTVIIEGVKPKRTRRTKAQMAEARHQAEMKRLFAEMLPLAQKRLAEATPGQRRAATRIVNRIVNGPKYRWS